MKSNRKPWLVLAVVAVLAALAYYGWQQINGGGLPDGFASGNGRIEATEIDERTARYVNDNLADYLLPVNADAPGVEVILLSEQDDQISPSGAKGLGELGNVGTNAAVCNAIFHATGQRIRKLPVRLENIEV